MKDNIFVDLTSNTILMPKSEKSRSRIGGQIRCNTSAFLLMLCISLAPLVSWTQTTFAFESGMPIKLGVGWDPQNPFSNKYVSGYFVEARPSTTTPSATDVFGAKFVDNFTEYTKITAFTLNANAHGKFAVFRAKGSASFEEERSLFSDTRNIIYVISGKRRYQSVDAFGIMLTPEGESFISNTGKSHSWTALKDRIGTHLVTGIVKEAEIHIVYVIQTSNSSFREKLKAAVSAYVTAPIVGGSAATSFTEHLKKVDQSVNVEVRIFHAGLNDDHESLAQLTSASPGDFSRLRELVSIAINQINWESALISTFSAEPLSNFFELPKFEINVQRMLSQTAQIRNLQEILIDRHLWLDDLIKGGRNHEFTFKENAMSEIEEEMSSIRKEIDLLDQLYKVAAEFPDTLLQLPNLPAFRGASDFVEMKFGEFHLWKFEVTGNHYDNHSERIIAQSIYWPVLRIENSNYIKRVEIIRNGNIVASLGQSELRAMLENGLLNLRRSWSVTYLTNEYCWRGRWGEDCTPWAGDVLRIANSAKSQDNNASYKCTIVDMENHPHTITMQPLSSAQLTR